MSREIHLANQEALLSQGDFVARRNNFHLYFCGRPGVNPHYIGEIYRQGREPGSVAFRQCLQREPSFQSVANVLYDIDLQQNPYSDDIEILLYSAYQMM